MITQRSTYKSDDEVLFESIYAELVKLNENLETIILTIDTPEYADDTAADADTTLLSGYFYTVTGDRTVYKKTLNKLKMPDKLDKIAQLTKNLNLPIKGLVKLKDTINIDDYDVVVQSKNEQKSYKINSSLLGSSGGGAILFPNGIEDVLVSRDFLHTDIGKALRLANDDVVLTMPEGVFWTEEEKGQIIVIIADAVNVGYDKTFEVPVLMQGRDEANSLVGEYSLLVTGETGGQSNVATISSTILKDGDNWKTAIRWLKDNIDLYKLISTQTELELVDVDGSEFIGLTHQTSPFKFSLPNLVAIIAGAINFGAPIQTGTDDPNVTPPDSNTIGDGYFQITSGMNPDLIAVWKNGGAGWVEYKINAIPLSGTVSGGPVTHRIEFNGSPSATFASSLNALVVGAGNDLNIDENATKAAYINFTTTNDIQQTKISSVDSPNGINVSIATVADSNLSEGYVEIVASGVSRGLVGTTDYSPNITDLDYTQKIYVDKVSGFKGTFSEPSAVAQTTFTVTIPTQADTTYVVMTEATNLLSAPIRYITNKTTTSFDVVYVSGLTGAVEFDYFVKR